jgi:site-specific DNA-methyltransferase (adenine-specific)
MTELADVLEGRARFALLAGESLRLLRELPDACVDAVICDPPYSSGGFTRGDRMQDTTTKYVMREGGNDRRPELAGDNRDQRSFEYWCVLWLAECLRIAKPGAPIAVFTDWRQLPVTTDAIQAGGWIWRGLVVWHKLSCVRPAMGRFSSAAEFVVWGSAGAMKDDPAVGCLDGVIACAQVLADKHHPTGKPVEVMRELVKVCPPGGLILDPFAGSGSTGVAALLEGRRFLGVEVVPHYAELARDRLAAEAATSTLEALRTGQVPLFGSES